jgi:hypothetical protein
VKARLLLDDKSVFADGSILAVRIWALPKPVPPATHSYKYSLFYGYPGHRLIGFDNERGKGDHKHVRGVETAYVFLSIARLLADFRAEVEMVRGAAI